MNGKNAHLFWRKNVNNIYCELNYEACALIYIVKKYVEKEKRTNNYVNIYKNVNI